MEEPTIERLNIECGFIIAILPAFGSIRNDQVRGVQLFILGHVR